MKLIAVVLFIAGSTAFAQRATSPSGFGRIANPGGVSGTTGGAGFGRVIYPGTGAPAAVRNQTGSASFAITPPSVSHGAHSTPVIVPYPVYYGGGYYPYDAPPAQYAGYPQAGGDQMQGAPPVVIINQYFRPDTANPILNDYSKVPLPEGVSRGPDGQPAAAAAPQDTQPIMFLIAMKDHTIYPALAYWVEGDTLNYITTQGTKNSASLDLVDRAFSEQLNRERKIDFGLPEKK